MKNSDSCFQIEDCVKPAFSKEVFSMNAAMSAGNMLYTPIDESAKILIASRMAGADMDWKARPRLISCVTSVTNAGPLA